MAHDPRGFKWGGRHALFNSEQGGTWSGTEYAGSRQRGYHKRGLAFAGPDSPTPGALFSPSGGRRAWGGTWDGRADPSIDDLIDINGFALVFEQPAGSERIAFSADEPAYRGIESVQWTTEVNNMASWTATVPANPELMDWSFTRAVIAYNGERRFTGWLIPIKSGQLSDGKYQLSGLGPLYWAGHGDITVSYAGMPSWRALEDVWARVARATNGRVRGTVVRPSQKHASDHWIPEAGVEWSGTPIQVLKKAHGYAGMAWSFDHSEVSSVAQSFVPGEQARTAEWKATSVNPAVEPEGYHNRVTVRGDGVSATVSAPDFEIQSVTNGLILERVEREPDYTTEQACHARASTLLAEDRGEYTIGGSLDVTPDVRRLVPGYTYRVPEFDVHAPEAFSPVWCTAQSITESYAAGEATVSVSFADESGLIGHVRDDLTPEGSAGPVSRRDTQRDRADANYEEPSVVFGAGAGAAGNGGAGG